VNGSYTTFQMPGVGETVTAVKNGTTQDIIDTLHKCIAEAKRQTANIAEGFKGATNYDTARNIWDYPRTHIDYVADGMQFQDIRLPGKFIRSSEGDCKSFTLFTVGVLANLDMPITIRYVSYDNSPTPSHVYALTKDNDGTPIIIDGVYHLFDAEEKYTHTPKDYNMDVRVLGELQSDQTKWRNYILRIEHRLDNELKPGEPGYDELVTEHKEAVLKLKSLAATPSNAGTNQVTPAHIAQRLIDLQAHIDTLEDGPYRNGMILKYKEGVQLFNEMAGKKKIDEVTGINGLFSKIINKIKKAVKSVEHSINVDATNAAAGIKKGANVVIKDAKGVVHTIVKDAEGVVHDIEHVALAPMRDIFLGIVLENGFD